MASFARQLATLAKARPRASSAIFFTNGQGVFEKARFWEQAEPIHVAAGFKHAAAIAYVWLNSLRRKKPLVSR
jgi:hypothetical protein